MFSTFRAMSAKLRAACFADPALLRFAAVGLITTSLDFSLFGAFTIVGDMPPVFANVASYSCGVVTSFLLNRFWTFGWAAGPMTHQAVRFIASNIAGLTISSVLVSIFLFVLPPIAAKALSIPLVFIWNYALARLWVFRRP